MSLFQKKYIWRGLGVMCATLFISGQAWAQTDKENICYNNVQNTVAWNQAGNTSWSPANIRKLCKGVNQWQKRVSCFERGIEAHNSWSRAMDDCKDSGTTLVSKKIPGKQCVYNKAGYALDVAWYDPGKVLFLGGDTNDYTNYKSIGDPVKTDRVTLGYSSCTDVANRVAVSRIVGHDIANAAITISAGVAVGVATGVVGAFACVGTAGAGCPAAVAGVAAVVSASVSATALALPNPQEIAYIGVPGTQNYLDLYGTVWKPQISNEIPLSQKRKPIEEGFNVAGNEIAKSPLGVWVNDGKPGPKSITFNNQAGYVASMSVIYNQEQNINVTKVLMPVVKSTGNQSLGFSRHINIPSDVGNSPIIVSIKGVGTTNNNFFSTTLSPNFSGNYCYKSWGTLFSPQGGRC